MSLSRVGALGLVVALCSLSAADRCVAAEKEETVKVSDQPLHSGHISPMLFGNFIELLDDLVPGMWAEMLNDRGFEGVVPPANWAYYDGSPTFCDRAWDKSDDWTRAEEQPFTGRMCAKILASGGRQGSLSQGSLAVRPREAYKVSAWIRSEGSVRVQPALEAKAVDGSITTLASAEAWEPRAQYTRFTATLAPNGSSDSASFVLKTSGQGAAWVDQVSLMPAENVDGWRADVVAAIKQARPALIRWGGSAVDPGAYRWKNGVGERDRRAPFANTNWGRIDSNDVGIDEFCQFCALVDAEPLVCVSFSDGAASAADLVEYCNGAPETAWGAKRALNGHRMPYRVKYWQLGNELSGNDDAYVAKCEEFIAAMKKADASIVVMSSFPSQKVLDRLGKDLGYLAPHHYTRDLKACEADFRGLSGMIAKTPGCGHLRLAVTEWNFTAGDWGLGRAKMLTLEGALWNARYLNLMCRHSNVVEIACRSNMTNSCCSGIIETNLGGLLKRPSYHVMKLYAEHALPVPLAVSALHSDVDVIACASEDRARICVFAVNTGREPVTLALDLAELGADYSALRAECLHDTFDRRQPDAMNHWQSPERVCTEGQRVERSRVVLPALSATAIDCGKP